MAYSNGKITGAVSISDVQKALGNKSSDVATLCSAHNINPWAKWRPLPIVASSPDNKPGVLTDAVRERNGWGMQAVTDAWATNTVVYQLFEMLNGQYDTNGNRYGNEAVPFDSVAVKAVTYDNKTNSFFRLSDFVCGDDHTKGYNHYAKPFVPSWHLSNSSVNNTIAPLIKEEERNIGVEEGKTAKFKIPNDEYFLRGWFGAFNEGASGASAWDNSYWNKANEGASFNSSVVKNNSGDSLSVVDAIVNCVNTIKATGIDYDISPRYSRRGVIVFVRTNYSVTDNYGGNSHNRRITWIPFGTIFLPPYPIQENDGSYRDTKELTPSGNNFTEINLNKENGHQYYLDLQDTDKSNVNLLARKSGGVFYSYYTHGNNGVEKTSWADLTGECIFMDIYTSNTGGTLIPIPGFAYKVNINRVTKGYGSDTVDIFVSTSDATFLNVQSGANSAEVYMDIFSGTSLTTSNVQSYLKGKYIVLELVLSRDEGMTQIVRKYDILNLTPLSTDTDAQVFDSASPAKPEGQTTSYNRVVFIGSKQNGEYLSHGYWIINVKKYGGASATKKYYF